MAKFNPKLHRRKDRRSTFEETIEAQLKAAGVKYEYESTKLEWTRAISSGYCLSCGHNRVGQKCDYTPDFILPDLGIWIEVKGYLDGSDRTKLKAIRKQYPDLDLRIVFQRNNPIPSTKEKTRYSEWAEKSGFKWALKEIPKEWLT